MAQIREFESTTESYFILDGVSYPKVYEAMLDNGYSDTKIKLVGTNRDTTPLVFSTQYTNIRVDGDSFDTALEAISRLNQIVFSKGGGSGTGGATNVITEDSDTVAFTGNGTAGTPLKAEVKSDGLDYIPLTGTEKDKTVTGDVETYNFFKTYSVAPNGNNFGYYFDEGTFKIFNDGFVQFDVGYDFAFGPDALILTLNGPSRKGIIGNVEYDKLGDRNAFAQLSDVYDANSYSTDETKTGGTWIDGKPIYIITQLTADTPPTMETVFPTEVIGTYTVYKYTKP